MNDFLTQDFFGHLKNRSLEYKKMKTLEIYRLIVRFSIEKVRVVSDTEVFQIIVLQYIKSTRLERLHQKDVLLKYNSNYYRAIENIVNCSQPKKVISDKVINTFDEEMFDINEGTESVVSFRKLQDENIRRQVQLDE